MHKFSEISPYERHFSSNIDHREYFPYGEVWVNEKAVNEDDYDLPYKYTGKEYDEETKLTYYGARYYDAQLSRWISVDPPLATGEYIGNDSSKLPGLGGVFNPINLNAYQYAGMNPIKYTDPDGNLLFRVPFTETFFFWQKKPLDNEGAGEGYRWGFTTQAEGRYIDPTAKTGSGFFGAIMSLFAAEKISFINDEPTNPTTDQKVTFKTAEMIEGVVRETGLSININSSTGGRHSQNSLHGKKRAVDINRVSDSLENINDWSNSVTEAGTSGDIQSLSNEFGNHNFNQENYNPITEPVNHSDHLHEGAVE